MFFCSFICFVFLCFLTLISVCLIFSSFYFYIFNSFVSPSMSNLLLIPPKVLFDSNNLSPITILKFLNIWNIVGIIVLMTLPAHSNICQFMINFGWYFSTFLSYFPVSFLHAFFISCKFYLGKFQLFLYSYKYSWNLFWDAVTLSGNSLILLGLL